MDIHQDVRRGDAEPDGQQDTSSEKDRVEQALQILANEQFVLSAASSSTISESMGRAALFLGTVASTLIALSFIAQISKMGEEFYVFGLVLFPTLFFLGLVTFVRTLDTAIQNVICVRGMNRIRHYYLEIAPQFEDYFVLSAHDDWRGSLLSMGAVPTSASSSEGHAFLWAGFLTTSGMIGVINSVLGGVFAAMLMGIVFTPPLLLSAGVGLVAFLLLVYAHSSYERHTWVAADQNIKVKFPSAVKAE